MDVQKNKFKMKYDEIFFHLKSILNTKKLGWHAQRKIPQKGNTISFQTAPLNILIDKIDYNL